MNDTVKLSRDNLTKTTDDGRIELTEETLTRVTGGKGFEGKTEVYDFSCSPGGLVPRNEIVVTKATDIAST